MRTRTLRIGLFCALAAIAALIAACGSSSNQARSNASQNGGTTTTAAPKAESVLACLNRHGIKATRSADGTIHASGSVSAPKLSEALGACARESGVSITPGSAGAKSGEVRHASEKYVECLRRAGVDTSSISSTPPAKLAEAARECSHERPRPLAYSAPVKIKVGKVQVGKIDLSHVRVKVGKIHIGKLHIEALEKLGTGKSAEGTAPAPAN